jgi:hypothetical protein
MERLHFQVSLGICINYREGISAVRLMCATAMLVSKVTTAGLDTISRICFCISLPFRYNCEIQFNTKMSLVLYPSVSGAPLAAPPQH